MFYFSGFALMLMLFAPLITIGYFVDKVHCFSAYEEYSPSHGVFSGCRIMWNGKLTPVTLIRNVTIEG
jgi:hypothetical protein